MIRPQPETRRGVAAVELGLVFMFFVVPLMLEIFEIGRLVQVQQIVSNSAREGARLAAQAYTISSTGTPTQIYATTAGGTPNVQTAVYNYLVAAGLTNLQMSDVTTTFTFTTPNSSGVTPTDPYLGSQNETFTVTVSIPWSKVRWVNLGFLPATTQVTFTVTWQMLIDNPFTVSTTLPTW
jgi:Flp pilus assembly protein TadG